MNAPLRTLQPDADDGLRGDHPFEGLAFSAAQHLRLALFGVIARIVEACADGDVEATLGAHPFLADYLVELDERAGLGDALALRWRLALAEWEAQALQAGVHLPLAALRRAGAGALEIELLLAAGVVEEDARFGDVFGRVQDGGRRPTLGLLTAWWRDDGSGEDRVDEVRAAAARLVDAGLLRVTTPDAARADWAFAVTLPVWDALRGDAPALPWLQHRARADATPLAAYIVPDARAAQLVSDGLQALLRERPAPTLLLRGPLHNGRKTLAGALAATQGSALLVARGAVWEDDARWRLLGILACVTGAMPVVEAELAAGESRVLPPLPWCDAPLLVVTGRHGAWTRQDDAPTIALHLPLPDEDSRRRHWREAIPEAIAAASVDAVATMRLSGGHVRRLARGATDLARLDGRREIRDDDVREARRALPAGRLEMLATRLETQGGLADLEVDDLTRGELLSFAARCRWREQLSRATAGAPAASLGVRALFAGPSGVGKTLAARLVAAELGKPLFRIDLAATVDKFLGETEKRLDQALNAAEELDVVLLFDEGDALMARRTDVGSSNDRHANLETNFLLQRLDQFEGILVVTSNAPDRIDGAFSRRMDAVLHFRLPDERQRYRLLRRHLPATSQLDDAWLQDAARRCALSGGQWANVALHARLLALQDGTEVATRHLHDALVREYRKTGAACPARPWLG